jgi:nitrogen-specific signal transduction histidine kinase
MRRLLGKVRASEKLLAKKNRRLARLFKTAHRFVDNVSHEFRTPLTVIKEYSSLVRDAAVGPVTKEQTELLDIVGDRADDLNTMVNDMLDMSKLEAGLHSAWRKRCRITDILQRMLPNLERKAQVKIVSLEIRCDDDLPDVFCDPEKIGRVIVNLTVNAIKFSGRPGKVAITVRADAEMREVVVEIADNGAGIHRDDLEAIYARFKQLPSRSRGSTKGFGLGLNIAKELVALNFGEIRVESELGQGSSFSFTIPMAQPREVFSRYLRRLPRSADEPGDVSLLVAEVADSTDPETADDVEALLHSVLRKRDLIFRRDPHAWIIILPAAEAGVARFHSRLGDYLEQTNRNRPFGPLPAVDLKTDSHWPLDEQVEQVLERIDAIMVTGEPSHACIS